MKTDTTKAAGDVADEKLFDNWFDPVETGLRAKVRGFIETMIEEELDTALSRPRYGRRLELTAADKAAAPIVGHRHGHRMRSLTGTFGPSPAMNLRAVLEQVPDPRGKQGQDYRLWSILSLIAVSLLCGRRGLRAAFLLGRSSNKLQRSALGFVNGNTPCHATLTETLRAIDGRALADALGAVCFVEGGDQRHIAIDGNTMRASKDGDGNATHVLSAFCAGLQSVTWPRAARAWRFLTR